MKSDSAGLLPFTTVLLVLTSVAILRAQDLTDKGIFGVIILILLPLTALILYEPTKKSHR
jgi:hypothetical protein